LDESLLYEDMLYYVEQIRKANDPLNILVNVDFLTDLIDEELENTEEGLVP
jgi:hypothetical protein